MSRPALIALCALFVTAAAGVARADVLADFDAASVAYREQRYPVAASAFEAIIATAANNPTDQAIALEARKYLAACYLFLERPADTDRQFERLLEADPTYRIDPAVFPSEFVERFENVRRRIDAARLAELEAQLDGAQAEIARQRAVLELDVDRYRSLYDFASSSLVVRRNSRLVAVLPFGIGQFQNGARRRGRWFAITEGIALAGYVGGYIWRRAIEDEIPALDQQSNWQRQMTGSLVLNWSSGITFLTLAVAGAIEAEANFVPTMQTSRPREVPEPLRPEAPAVQAEVRVSPLGGSLRLRF